MIVPLQAEGYECIAAQYGLNSTAEDVALTKATIGRVSSPVILVGHSYGGSVITGAGTDDRVVGLVHICALAQTGRSPTSIRGKIVDTLDPNIRPSLADAWGQDAASHSQRSLITSDL